MVRARFAMCTLPSAPARRCRNGSASSRRPSSGCRWRPHVTSPSRRTCATSHPSMISVARRPIAVPQPWRSPVICWPIWPPRPGREVFLMQDEPTGAGLVSVSFTLNGAATTVTAPPFASVADTLRERLCQTGTKVGCEAGDCGACTIIVNGRQVCACLLPTARAADALIWTVEGDGPDGLTARLRTAFLARGAAQCGICTPGMLMAATDLMARDARPSRAAIEAAIGGVLCRCTGYLKIIEAILDVTQGSGSPRATVASAAIGSRLPRVDGWPKVAGTDVFAADAAPADALWMRIVRAPHASARFCLGDLEAVRRATPGLSAILTHKDVPGENAFGIFPNLKDQPVLAPGVVRFRGEAVLALVGTRAALDRLSDAALPIRWQECPALSGLCAALAPGAPALHAQFPDNVLARGNLKSGDVDQAFQAAAVSAEGAFETAFVEHAYIEPEAGYALPLGAGPDAIEIAASTQAPYVDREETARVHSPDGVRRRLRWQARRFRATPARRRGLGDQAARAHRLLAHRIHGLDHQAPPGADSSPGRGRRRGAPHGLSHAGRFRYGCLCLLGPNGRQPRARPRHGALSRGQCGDCDPRGLHQ